MKKGSIVRSQQSSGVLPFRPRALSTKPPLHEFVPYFQPIADLRTGQIAGLELLARWQHPSRGMLLPDAFIQDAETEGWVGDLMCVLLARALIAAKSLPDTMYLSFNLSPVQLLDHGLPGRIEKIAQAVDFPLRRLTAEITETALAQDHACALSIARELKAMGCKLSLDDFGTGYSSLLHLQSLPFDEIKVDRSFVSGMLERKECRKIVSAVVGLGRSLGIRTVAEGVEDVRQVEMLRWLGCDSGQGWLLGRPLPGSAISSLLAQEVSLLSPFPAPDQDTDLATATEQIAELRALYDGAPVGLAFVDREFHYRNVNEKLAELNGMPVHAHLGRHVQQVIPGLYPVVSPYLQRALAGEATHDLEVTFRHTRTHLLCTRRVSYQPVRDEAGEVIGVSVAVAEVLRSKTRVPCGDVEAAHLIA